MMIILAALSTVGVVSLCWVILGAFLLPVGTSETLHISVLVGGSAENVEHTLKGLLWLRRVGLLRATVQVVDAGLNGAGRAQVTWLCKRVFKNVTFATKAEI